MNKLEKSTEELLEDIKHIMVRKKIHGTNATSYEYKIREDKIGSLRYFINKALMKFAETVKEEQDE